MTDNNEQLISEEDAVIGLRQAEDNRGGLPPAIIPTINYATGGNSRGTGETARSRAQGGRGKQVRCAICDAVGVTLRKLKLDHPDHDLKAGQYVCATGCKRENLIALRKMGVGVEVK